MDKYIPTKTAANSAEFQTTVWSYYSEHGRHDLPWRLARADEETSENRDVTFDPYKILVSEIMLQQTQVSRVVPKYLEFLHTFPTVQALAKSELGSVLVAWQGLGYNRRAKYLWQTAQRIATENGGEFPQSSKQLVGLPGIGVNTAGAIMAYAYNQPVAFVETNIRTVYIYHFFADETDVADKVIIDIVRSTLPNNNIAGQNSLITPRTWYWALMDYGTHLKQTVGNKARAGDTYVRQSPFYGSRRQVRGVVIRRLGFGRANYETLESLMPNPDQQDILKDVLKDLIRESMVRSVAGTYSLT